MSAFAVLEQLPFPIHERYRRALYSSSVSIASKGLGFVSALITIPLAVRYLGPERYGVWIGLSSFIAMAAHVDLGLGNGLVSAIAAANGKDDRNAAAEACSSAFFLLAALALAAIAGFYAVDRWFLFSHLVQTRVEFYSEARAAFWILALLFALKMPLGVIDIVQAGYQEGYRANWWQAAGNAASLGLLLFALSRHAGLPWLVVAAGGGPFVASACNFANELLSVRPWIRPRLSRLRWASGVRLIRTGFLLGLAGLVAMSTAQLPLIIIGAQLGAAAAATYGVSMRLLSVLPVFASVILMPLWPAYTEALTRGDRVWATRTFARTLRLCAITAALGGAVFAFSYREILSRWASTAVVPPFAVALACCVFTAATTIKWATWMFLNGRGSIRPMAIHPIPGLLAGAAAAAFGARAFGLAGIAAIFAGVETLTVLLQLRAARAALRTGV